MRTRFAPSPTGFLHVGGLRTALYAYLVARQKSGTFLLRIEDTDQTRSVPGAVENILRTLEWVNIRADEGVVLDRGIVSAHGEKGPYVQSERLDLYAKYAQQLIDSGHAYHCFCTADRLQAMRERQITNKQAPMYDRHCLRFSKPETKAKLDAGEQYVIRLKMPHGETISFEDDVRGHVEFQAHLVDDQVLVKSDGFPTYHLAHVVDDHLMDIDIIIRGEEWLSSLPKHVVLFAALGWNTPRYAHIPLLLNADRSKLSKRQGDVSAESYKEHGYLPEAMINFLAFLGWNPGTEQEIFSLQELIEGFSLERVQKAGAVLDLEKLDWLQGQWIRKLSSDDLAERIRPIVAEKYPSAAGDFALTDKVKLIQARVLKLTEAADMLSFFYEMPHADLAIVLNKKMGVTEDNIGRFIDILLETLTPVVDWTLDRLTEELERAVTANNLKRGQLLWPLRAILTGKPFSPGAHEVAVALGKEETCRRLTAAKNKF